MDKSTVSPKGRKLECSLECDAKIVFKDHRDSVETKEVLLEKSSCDSCVDYSIRAGNATIPLVNMCILEFSGCIAEVSFADVRLELNCTNAKYMAKFMGTLTCASQLRKICALHKTGGRISTTTSASVDVAVKTSDAVIVPKSADILNVISSEENSAQQLDVADELEYVPVAQIVQTVAPDDE
jgi:hypothetical protein